MHERKLAAGDHALRAYIVASLPNWLIIGAICLLLYSRGDLEVWGALAILSAPIVSDLVLFPRRRRYYTSEPADKRMIGEQGIAVSDLAPRGFVRVHGELWQAETMQSEQTIRKGDTLRVRDIRGLELIVDRRNEQRSDSAAQ